MLQRLALCRPGEFRVALREVLAEATVGIEELLFGFFPHVMLDQFLHPAVQARAAALGGPRGGAVQDRQESAA